MQRAGGDFAVGAHQSTYGGDGHGDAFLMDVQTEVEDIAGRFHGCLFPFLFNGPSLGTPKLVDRPRAPGASHATSETDTRQFLHQP